MSKQQSALSRPVSEVANVQVEVLSSESIKAITSAEVDIQVATAMNYPRSLKQFMVDAVEMATLDDQTASECIYALERKDGNSKKVIRGPSIRLAEICASCYKHMRIAARIVGDEGNMVVAQGVAHDLQNNVAMTSEVRRRITTRDGRRYSDDMVATTMNAANSIALRNAIFRVVPKAFVNQIQTKIEEYIAEKQGSGKKLLSNARAAIKWFQDRGVAEAQVLAKIGRSSVETVTAIDIVTLRGFVTAVDRDNTTTLAELFPVEAPVQKSNLVLKNNFPPDDIEESKAEAPTDDEEDLPFR